MTRKCGRVLAIAILLASAALPAAAGRVVLRIQAGNPVDRPQTVQVKSALPQGVSTNDILSLGGLSLGYDVRSEVYFVHKSVELGPKEIVSFDVEINDIWQIPEEDLTRLDVHSRALAERLQDTKDKELATTLRRQISDALAQIQASQNATRIGQGVSALDHIRAYESNAERLKLLRRDLGRLENLALVAGRDPGALIGDDYRVPAPDRVESDLAATGTARIRISVENASPNESRKVSLRRELPVEVRERDVIATGELKVSTDREKGVAYLYSEEIELGPGEARTFEVTVRDRWNVNRPRIDRLLKSGEELLARLAVKREFRSAEENLRQTLNELQGIRDAKRPETLDPQYVAYYRDETARVDAIEQRINRLVLLLPQIDRTTKIGTKIKPPSAKTTWGIIFGIVAFLGILSVVFFARWMGHSKSEEAERSGGVR